VPAELLRVPKFSGAQSEGLHHNRNGGWKTGAKLRFLCCESFDFQSLLRLNSYRQANYLKD
jgi:hypothetical protein